MDEEQKTSAKPEDVYVKINDSGNVLLNSNNRTLKDERNTKSQVAEIEHKYIKRKGTSKMMTGPLNKTNLLSLILYRSLVKKMEFVLGCNVDGIGGMGDISYRFYRENNKNKPAVVFIKTNYKDYITDKNLNSAKSDLSLIKCFEDFLRIRDSFKIGTDLFFKGNTDNVQFYFIIYSPYSCNIESRIAVSDTDKIFTDKLNNILHDGTMDDNQINKLFQIKSETLLDDNTIYEKLEYIGKTIAAYVTSADEDNENVDHEMINTITQYHHYLIPDVIKIKDLNGDCYGEFSDSLFKSSDKFHNKLKEIIYTQVLKKTKRSKAECFDNQISLLSQGGDIKTFIANGLTISDNNEPVIFEKLIFDELSNKLVFRLDTPLEFTQGEIEKVLDKIVVTKAIIYSALEIAIEKTLKSIKILITSKIKKIIEYVTDTNTQNTVSDLENDINKAKFLDCLYIYSAQGNLVEQLKQEIRENQVADTNTSIFQCKPELLYLQLHNKVQKWWLLQDDPYYLTNYNCDFLEMGTFVNFPHLSILSLRCVNELERYWLKFKELSTNLFKKIGNSPSRASINIVSNDVLISCIKLSQFLNRSGKSYLFADFEHVSNMKEKDYEKLLEELSKANIDTFVIVMYKAAANKMNRLQQILESYMNEIVIVSKSELTDIKTNNIIKDGSNSLADIDNASEVLKHTITVQGIEDKLENILQQNKHIIKDGILSMIIKQEKIELGNKLADSVYERLKNYFVERKIIPDTSNSDSYEQQLSVFLDIKEPVVTIVSGPGMGKSNLMTHLSVKTKCKFPFMWVVRMNLLDYVDDFFNWHKNLTEIGLKESLCLVCKAEIGNDDKFTLEELDGVIVINNKELEGTTLLHLEMIIHSFNEGYIILIFDGFDEICPDYKKETVQFMKNFVDWNKRHGNSHSSTTRGSVSKREIKRCRIWITSRPYNTIKNELMRKFSTPFYLQNLTKDQQTLFYHKYWEDHIKIETLSKEQFDNIEAFFKYMNQYRHGSDSLIKPPTVSIVPLRLMHEAAVDYFRSKISSTALDIDTEAILNRWVSKDQLQTIDKCNYTGNSRALHYVNGLELAGTPLHMHIYADLFVSEINGSSSSRKWELDVHTFEFYERFLEIKLKKIRFEEKGREDVSSSASKLFYEEEKETFILKHKWLALYSFFAGKKNLTRFAPPGRLEAIDRLLGAIQRGEEKTGLVDRINFVDNVGVPHFVHYVFAEYFAVECIADLLKKTSYIYHIHLMIYFVFNELLRVSEGIITVFDNKLKNDEKLREKLKEKRVRKFIFKALLRQHGVANGYKSDYYQESETTLNKLLVNRAKNTIKLFLNSVDGNLDHANIKTFIDYIGKDFCVSCIKFDDHLIEHVLDAVRNIDPYMIRTVLDQCDLNELDECLTNEEILKHMHVEFASKVDKQ